MNPFDTAEFIGSLVPWLNCPIEIMDYMSTLPGDQKSLTLQMTLKHFFASKDDSSPSLRSDILDEALDITRVFPNVSHKEIKDRLLVLGDIPNRKEVVLRQLLQKESDKLMRSTSTSKRNHCDYTNETSNFNIKIKKLNGELKVIPNTKQNTKSPKVHPVESIASSSGIQAETTNIDSGYPLGGTELVDDYQKRLQQLHPKEFGTLKQNPSVDDSIAYMDFILAKNREFIDSFDGDCPPLTQQEPLDSFEPLKKEDDIEKKEDDEVPFNDCIRAILGWEGHNNEPPKIPTPVECTTVLSDSSATIIQDEEENEEVLSLPSSPFGSWGSPIPVNHDSPPSSPSMFSSVDDMSIFSNNSEYGSTSPLPEFVPDIPFPVAEESRPPMPRPFEGNLGMEIKRNKDLKRKTGQKLSYEEAGPSTMGAAADFPIVVVPSPPKIQKMSGYDPTLVSRLSEMFPETCIDYIRRLCEGKLWNQFEELIEIMLGDPNRPKREIKQRVVSPPPQISHEDQLKIVKEILPDADPTFLEIQCENLNYNPEAITQFLDECRENKNYPTMKEYLRKQQLSAQSKQYTEEFDIEKFVELFPNPEETFSDPKRNVKLDEYSLRYLKVFFENKFNKLPKRVISKALFESGYKVLKIDAYLQDLMNKNQTMKSKRKTESIQQIEQNIPLLQELAYLTHKDDIQYHIEMKKKQINEKREYAKANGLMNTCSCCYGDEVMPEDTFYCPKQHPFCRDCIKTSCGIALGEGRTVFKCLADCTEDFPLSMLQQVLEPKMFSNLARKQALAEIKAAGLDNLEVCPFCDFASIPNPQDRIFRCLNPECMKESCRECKEPSHLPLRCDEIEKDEHVKARIHIENKMTEALLRKCFKCGTSFFKEEGCNKMTCTCGAAMCYVCNKPVDSYKHFNGLGGDKFDLCPLYSDTNELNRVKVLEAAQVAKKEVVSELKVDPTIDIDKHFEERKKVLGVPTYLNALVHQQPLPVMVPPELMGHHYDRHAARGRRRRLRDMRRNFQREHLQALEAIFNPHHM